ncbi:hypothetical protein MRB53_041776 [Persea americana]|nr:hypothetical protein MRB53_041776 [Persea americana]
MVTHPFAVSDRRRVQTDRGRTCSPAVDERPCASASQPTMSAISCTRAFVSRAFVNFERRLVLCSMLVVLQAIARDVTCRAPLLYGQQLASNAISRASFRKLLSMVSSDGVAETVPLRCIHKSGFAEAPMRVSDDRGKPQHVSQGNGRALWEYTYAAMSAVHTAAASLSGDTFQFGTGCSKHDEEYDLSELGAPTPVQKKASQSARVSNHIARQRVHTTRDRDKEQQGLTEVVAPPPVQEEDPSKQWRRDDTLEHAESSGQNLVTESSGDSGEQDGDATKWRQEHDLEQSRRSRPTPLSSKQSKLVTQLYIHGYLVFFAIFGTLARLGIQWLTFYPGAPVVISNLWANFGGTLLMGFLSEDREMFQQVQVDLNGQSKDQEDSAADKAAHSKFKKTVPLFIGLTTGFCGCLTSFSTFARDMFFALSNEVATPNNHPGDDARLNETVPRNKGYDFTSLCAVVLLTFGMSISALYVGAHIAVATASVLPHIRFRLLRRFLDPIMCFLGFGCWFGAVIMAIWPPDRPGGTTDVRPWHLERWRGLVLFALVFSPLGCILRYWASAKLNGRVPSFPLGTFFVNMFGVAIFSMVFDLQHVPIGNIAMAFGGNIGGGVVGCQVLQGILDGFCGCLTTISTFVMELTSLRKRHAYLYGSMSAGIALALTVVIMGVVSWTIGFIEPACAIETS